MTTDNPVMNTASPTELHALPTGELVRRLIDAASDATSRPYLDGLMLAAAGRLNGQERVLGRTIGVLWEEAEANAYRDWQISADQRREHEREQFGTCERCGQPRTVFVATLPLGGHSFRLTCDYCGKDAT